MKVIIIGSGIVGASAAYHLAKNNIEVVMVDKQHQGNATAAGAGIVCPWISRQEDNNWYEIAKRGAKFYPELIAQLSNDGVTGAGYKKVGALRVSSDSDVLDKLAGQLKEKQKDAPEMGDFEKVDSEKARELFPPLNDNLEAIYLSGAARVDGRMLRDALKRAAQKHGATLVNGAAELISRNNDIKGVTVNGEDIYADSVIIAAGAWSPALLTPLGLDLKIEPQRGQIAHISMTEADTSNWPVILPQTGHYMLAFDDSRVVAGATRETGSGFDYRMTAGGVSEVMDEALTVAPGLNDGTLQEVRIGFRPMGPDISPLLGFVEPFDNMVMVNGLGASGLTIGPYAGKLAASIMMEEGLDFNLSPYDPMRAIAVESSFH
ncbi:FAD-binding oxidoreductase [Lentibacillus sp. CBA3610]|uniref:NAD(P)/FAD-dependent oxidoreductase n=1 Tax=Lentibacillus sp. CBA3610 TaxID=2518176 RepID=UPI0015952C9A|nr:FAD-dependent oxidoreductase [Lentibacillus sp. CBA3610]QKY68767.1 FAD-binding oxidoreductase [Lentibacillus sp. CBA3610]